MCGVVPEEGQLPKWLHCVSLDLLSPQTDLSRHAPSQRHLSLVLDIKDDSVSLMNNTLLLCYLKITADMVTHSYSIMSLFHVLICFLFFFQLVQSFPNQAPSKGREIRLRGYEIVNGKGKKNKQRSDTQLCLGFLLCFRILHHV